MKGNEIGNPEILIKPSVGIGMMMSQLGEERRCVRSWTRSSLRSRFMQLILSPDYIQMSISPRHTPGKLLHYSCVNGNQHANEHQKVVTAKRGSKMYNLEKTRT